VVPEHVVPRHIEHRRRDRAVGCAPVRLDLGIGSVLDSTVVEVVAASKWWWWWSWETLSETTDQTVGGEPRLPSSKGSELRGMNQQKIRS
jgi:hypothetical protein